MEKFEEIAKKQIKTLGVQALHDRPNAYSRYGSGAMTAQQLKEAFDALAELIIDHYNEIVASTKDGSFAEYVKLPEGWGDSTLNDFLSWFSTGGIADKLYAWYPGLGYRTLNTILGRIVLDIRESCATVKILEEQEKTFKLAAYNDYGELIGAYEIQVGRDNIVDGSVTLYKLADEVMNLVDDKINGKYDDVIAPEIMRIDNKHIQNSNMLYTANMSYTESLTPYTVSSISYDPKTGVLSLIPMTGNQDAKTIDLPLELTVERGYYDSETGEAVIVLTSGDEVRIPVSDLLTDIVSLPVSGATDRGKIPVVELGTNKYMLKQPEGIRYASDGFTFYPRGNVAYINGYSGTDQDVVVPSQYHGSSGTSYSVAAINDGAFSGNKNIASVRLPSTVTQINSGAFYGCTYLKDVIVEYDGGTVNLINSDAFLQCPQLKIHVPEQWLAEYKMETNWVALAGKLEGYETIESLRQRLGQEIEQRNNMQNEIDAINSVLEGFVNVAEVGA